MLRNWDRLPDFMRIPEVKPYWETLYSKRWQLYIKRAFDICAAIMLLFLLAIPMFIIAVMIKVESKGPIFYRQERVTAYGKVFRIHKFRTMIVNADKMGAAITVGNDSRITKVGKRIRSLRLDEFPQLFDVLSGNMTFVGTRPEVAKYVNQYKPEYIATLLLPAGITSNASIEYKNEAKLLGDLCNVDNDYLTRVLPVKMKYNLNGLLEFSLLSDFRILLKTIYAVFGD